MSRCEAVGSGEWWVTGDGWGAGKESREMHDCMTG